VVHRSQRFLADRLELARYDLKTGLRGASVGGGLIVLGGTLMGLSWIAFMAVLVLLLSAVVAFATAIAIVAAAHMVLGATLLAVGRKRVRDDVGAERESVR